jgi:hypothetical protein
MLVSYFICLLTKYSELQNRSDSYVVIWNTAVQLTERNGQWVLRASVPNNIFRHYKLYIKF